MKQPDLITAIRLYYEKSELGTQDIIKLFDVSNSGAAKMKKKVRQAMAEKNVKSFYPHSINTEVAYELWGIDIEKCEARLKRLRSLKLAE
ncbi:MAG: hypothetical protein J5994_10675 [Ruminococcus sp.]|nr:hypothetical protein [Ruminococcus sp.]